MKIFMTTQAVKDKHTELELGSVLFFQTIPGCYPQIRSYKNGKSVN